ncbi:hypothetical protein J4401_02215 [Candidatus Woesearchaeota archaeon]|nr:hypothetical protein [Candidatus Woesearchaeota archaeon]
MSQIEQNFRLFLSRNPEIEKCCQNGLINRRSLARRIIDDGIANKNQLDAAIAMLRRFDYGKEEKGSEGIFKNVKVTIKNNILIASFEKSKEIVRKAPQIMAHINYDRGDTLKVVVGSTQLKVFIDAEKQKIMDELFSGYKVLHRDKNISEISMQFPDISIKTKGIISVITRELLVHGVNITELLTASPELLVYVNEEYVLKSYEIINALRN